MILPSRSFGIVAATRPKIKIAVALSPDYDPNAVNWNNLNGGGFTCVPYSANSAVQFTGINQPITLRLTVHGPAQEFTDPPSTSYPIYYRKSSSIFSANAGGCTPNGFIDDAEYSSYTLIQTYRSGAGSPAGTITVNPNDYLAFLYEGEESDGITVKVFNLSGSSPFSPIDTFTIYQDVTTCYLTTTIVGYFGLSDNGPELTAMRALRNHYKNVSGYSEILSEYSTVSSGIISGIEESDNKHSEYTYIHNTVIAVMNHVNAEEWEQAHDLYMAMYMDLKTRYVG
jgi:hypothetical protein